VRKAIIILAVLYPLAGNSFALEPIGSAFGKRLGSSFDPASAVSVGELFWGDGEKTYTFTPLEPYAGLDTYYVLLTPITHRIYGIWAQQSMTSDEDCHREQDALMAILRKKYGPSNDPDKKLKDCWFFCFRTFSIKQGSRSVESSCNAHTNLMLRYTDHNLEKIKDAEDRELKAKEKELEQRTKRLEIEEKIRKSNTKGF
jgi:hypothetical protein